MLAHAKRRRYFTKFIASRWFRLSGYLIIARRWRAVTGEVDLVVEQRYLLVSVKVKYCFDSEQIAAQSTRQCQRIRSTATLPIAKYPKSIARNPNFSDYQYRLDLFIMYHRKFFGVGHVAHLKNALQ